MLIRRDRALTALEIMLDVAFHAGRTGTVPASELATRLAQARRGLEPLLQILARAQLLESIRGPRGGYRLARPARDISLAEIAAAMIEAQPFEPVSPLVAVADAAWNVADQAALRSLRASTLEDLVRQAVAAGLRRPALEPVSYAI